MTDKIVKIKNIKFTSWVIILVVWILCGIGIWQSLLPFFAERHYREGYNFSAGKRYRYAIEELKLACKDAPWETHYWNQLGKDYISYSKIQSNKNDKVFYLKKAEELYLKCIEDDERNPWFKNRLAKIYSELMKLADTDEEKKIYFSKAASYTRAAAISDSNNPLFQLNLAYFLHKNGNNDEAEKYYKKSLEIDGRMIEARYNLAFIYRNKKQFNKALEQYLKIYQMKPKYTNIKIAIASTYVILDQPQNAIPFLEENLIEIPTHLDTLINLSSLYLQTKQWQKASILYENLFELYPSKKIESHGFYIQALVNASQVFKAKESLELFIQENPNDETALNQLNKINQIIKDNHSLIQ
jgi:tetratricopeptide (TPR) repeat protein